jgi:ribonuclease I
LKLGVSEKHNFVESENRAVRIFGSEREVIRSFSKRNKGRWEDNIKVDLKDVRLWTVFICLSVGA